MKYVGLLLFIDNFGFLGLVFIYRTKIFCLFFKFYYVEI